MCCSDNRRLYLLRREGSFEVERWLRLGSAVTGRVRTITCAKMTKHCPRRWPPSPTTSASGTLYTHPLDTLTYLIKQIFTRYWFISTFLRCPPPPPTATIGITLADDRPHDKVRSNAAPLRVSKCNPVKQSFDRGSTSYGALHLPSILVKSHPRQSAYTT